jgi:hypothetical protein
MQHQHVLSVLVLHCGGEVEAGGLRHRAVHDDELVVQDGVPVIDPHRHTLIRKERGRF